MQVATQKHQNESLHLYYGSKLMQTRYENIHQLDLRQQ